MAVIYVRGETLPKVWEESVIRTWREGDLAPTEYDQSKDPNSRDVNAFLHVTNPQKEPRIHKAVPGGYDNLETYRLEVAYGIHDHWVPKGAYEMTTEIGRKRRYKIELTEDEKEALKNPEFQKWSYTYFSRMFLYDTPDGQITNQFDEAIEKLVEAPHSRRAMISLLKPWGDVFHQDPPCLNLVQFRVFDDKLRMHVTMRSNDAFKAAFMNMLAFTELQKVAALRLSDRLGREIVPGDYTQNSISYHIYGSYFSQFENFLDSLTKRKFEERVCDSTDPIVQQEFAVARLRELQYREQLELPPVKKFLVWGFMSDKERAALPENVKQDLEKNVLNP